MEFLTEAEGLIKAKDRVKESLKRYPLLATYADPLEFVFYAFYIQGGHVIYQDHMKSSEFNPVPLNGRRVANLVIGAKDRKDTIDIIWSVFHEWGHLSQLPQTEEIRLNQQLTYYRESEAWDIAEIKLREYPTILPFIDKFYVYRDFCLNDYKKRFLNKADIKGTQGHSPPRPGIPGRLDQSMLLDNPATPI